MTNEEQVAWERRFGPLAAGAAVSAALLGVVAGVYRASAVGSTDGTDEFLEAVDRESSTLLVTAGIQAVGLLLLAPALVYLYRAARHRRPQTLRAALPLAVLGPLGAGVFAVVQTIVLGDVADDFLAGEAIPGVTREDRAEDVIEDADQQVAGGGLIASYLALGFAVIAISSAAMRAGLTSRFLGIIGIVVGVLHALGPVATGTPQIIQLFWLGALAALFLDRYPGGRGPAWEAGEAEPWPSAGARGRLEELGIGSGGPNGRGPQPESADPDVPRAEPRPASRKRKRKRR